MQTGFVLVKLAQLGFTHWGARLQHTPRSTLLLQHHGVQLPPQQHRARPTAAHLFRAGTRGANDAEP